MSTVIFAILFIFLGPAIIVGGVFFFSWLNRRRLKRSGVCLQCHDREGTPGFELRQEKTRRLVEKARLDPETGMKSDVYEADGAISNEVREVKCKGCGKVLWKRDWN